MFSHSIAASTAGVQAGLASFQQSAAKIANPDGNSGINEMVEIKLAEAQVKTNVAVIRRSFEMSDELIDILA